MVVVEKKDRVKEIEERIAELKRRWPAHSVPPQMWVELEELENELEEAEKTATEESNAREDGISKLQ
jgi:DNA repair exonuclease SbcCD ATPase subunit